MVAVPFRFLLAPRTINDPVINGDRIGTRFRISAAIGQVAEELHLTLPTLEVHPPLRFEYLGGLHLAAQPGYGSTVPWPPFAVSGRVAANSGSYVDFKSMAERL